MKLRQQAGSLVAIGAGFIVAVAVFLDRGKVSDRERQDREHDVFPAYRRADIDLIQLSHGADALRIERRPDPGDGGDTHWQITAPVDEKADPAAVDRFVGDLEFAGVIRRVEAGSSPAIAAGFVSPRATGTLSMKPLVYHFALGGPAPVPEGAAYLRVDGEGTFVVGKDFVASLMNGADAYRDRTVVPYLSLDLAGLAVDGPDGSLSIARVDDLAFKTTKDGLRVARDGLDRVWGALAEARASSFLKEGDAERALGEGAVHVVMTPKDESRPKGELRIGGHCPGRPDDVVLVRTSPTRVAACVPKGALPGLATGEAALLDRHLFSARADEVEELTLETLADATHPAFVVELARKGRGWHERRPSDRTLEGAEADAVNDLVTRLTRAEALSVSRAGTGGALTVRGRVKVRRGGAGAEESLELADRGERVRRTVDGAELQVSPDLARRLVASEIALRGRAVFADGFGGRAPVAVKVACGDVAEALVQAGGSWRMTEPAGFQADGLAVADVLALVRNAQAEAWVAEADDGSFGFAGRPCSIEVEASGEAGARTFGLVFGRETEDGGVYARTVSGTAVFVAPHPLRDGIATWLVDRGAFHVDRASIDQVVLARAGARVVLRGGHAETDGGLRDGTARALEALDVLRPDSVVRLGPPLDTEGFGPPTLDVRVKLTSPASGAPPGRAPREVHFVLGNTALVGHSRVVYARVDGVRATFGIARERVAPLIDAL